MVDTLNILPPNVPIGTVQDAAGNTLVVMATPEFLRAQGAMLARVGGSTSLDLAEIMTLFASELSSAAVAGDMSRRVDQLALQVHTRHEPAARLAALERRIEDLARLLHSAGPAPVDWEHPGKIGASAANSGKFTTLTATNKVTLSPADKNVEIKPTGTALVTIQPYTTGQIENMELGKTQPRAATVTTINKMSIAAPANNCTLAIADGKTLAVGNSMTLFADESATLNFTTGPGATFVRRGGGGLGSAATDAASTQTLANNIRAVLLSVGIGS